MGLRALLLLVAAACALPPAAAGVGDPAAQPALCSVPPGPQAGASFMACLNRTAGQPAQITLQGDVHLRPADWAPYAVRLPLPTGNAPVTIRGQPGARPLLDFGGALGLSHHNASTVWVMENLHIQGLATHSAGYAAGFGYEMVNGVMWPTTTGDPGHLMVFRNVTIERPPGTPCSANATLFKVDSMRRAAGSNDIVDSPGDGSFTVRRLFEGSYPVRDLATGDFTGNVEFTFWNVTVACSSLPAPPGAGPPDPPVAALASARGVGIAGSARDLLYYLGVDNVTQIILADSIKLDAASVANVSLPIVLARGRRLTLRSSDGKLKVLDLGQVPWLLMLEATASLTLSNLEVQGMANPSQVYGDSTHSVQLEGSPLWPSVDGVPGHQLTFQDSHVHEVDTPCSTNSTQIQIELLRRAMGNDSVVRAGDTSYTIVQPTNRTVYFRNLSTRQQLFQTTYAFDRTTITCQEDPGVALANEILATWSPPSAGSSSHSSSGPSHTVLGVIVGGAVGGAALAAAAAATLLARRRRRARRVKEQQVPAGAGAGGAVLPLSTMESGELGRDSAELLKVAPLEDPSDPQQAKSCSAVAKNTLWRSKFGVVEGLEILDLLGRGACGRVYKGRWNGALVAVKVVEHRVVPGKTHDLSREPVLSLTVSHPNCITSYKLTIVKVVTDDGSTCGEGASSDAATGEPLGCSSAGSSAARAFVNDLAPAGPEGALLAATCASPFARTGPRGAASTPFAPTAASMLAASSSASASGSSAGTGAGGSSSSGGAVRGRTSGSGGRRLQALVSGAAAVEVVSPNKVLEPGLYETWIISEYADQRTLLEAIREGKLRLPGQPGEPDMLAVYLCLLDIALGMEYLHTDLNILHGDLKPANVLLKGARNDRRGFICKLADFGLSRLLGAQDTHVDTSSVGTPSHAAPEVLTHGRVSKQGDVYSFGILAWELVSGEDPYPGMMAVGIILQVSQNGSRPAMPPSCPPALRALIERCWHQDPVERPTFPRVVGELKEQILDWRRQAGPQPLPRPPRRSTDSAMSGPAGQ